MKVVIVECREALEGRFESDLAYVAASWEAAVGWIRQNPDWCDGRLWWWVAFEQEVDGETKGTPRFFDRAGMELRHQPAPVPVDMLRT